jgi:methylmalonyl-CoA/ethylmalonyl-CoA epimerase
MPKVKGIAHVGIALKSVDEPITTFGDYFGARLLVKAEVPEQKQISALVALGEDTLELMEPTHEDAVVARYIQSRGEGIHHISLEVEGLPELLAELEKKGVVVIGKQLEGKERIAFLHPKSTHGVLFELREEVG